MLFIGDVHGNIKEYQKIIENAPESIQLGDFGYGFMPIPKFPIEHKFIPGNHDNRQLCLKVPNCLGNFGYLENKGIFFVSGALSIDKHLRVEGHTWWRDEQLSFSQMIECYDSYDRILPKIVISHDCPDLAGINKYADKYRNPTTQLLDAMFTRHRPEVWIFGHHHESFKNYVNGTQFIGLAELETIDI
jgi:hypothetical protein